MAIDYWELSKEFETGDVVQQCTPGSYSITPYVGVVVQTHPSIGFVDVKWPFSTERISPEELIKVNPANQQYIPPSLGIKDLKLAFNSRLASYWSEPFAGFHTELASLFHKGASEVSAYDSLWLGYNKIATDYSIKTAVARFYKASDVLTKAYLSDYAVKTAAYWTSKDRKYRATQQELDTGKVICPSCKHSSMRKTTYKMESSVKAHLLACPKCLYLIKQSDILDPNGVSVSW